MVTILYFRLAAGPLWATNIFVDSTSTAAAARQLGRSFKPPVAKDESAKTFFQNGMRPTNMPEHCGCHFENHLTWCNLDHGECRRYFGLRPRDQYAAALSLTAAGPFNPEKERSEWKWRFDYWKRKTDASTGAVSYERCTRGVKDKACGLWAELSALAFVAHGGAKDSLHNDALSDAEYKERLRAQLKKQPKKNWHLDPLSPDMIDTLIASSSRALHILEKRERQVEAALVPRKKKRLPTTCPSAAPTLSPLPTESPSSFPTKFPTHFEINSPPADFLADFAYFK